MRCVCGGRRFCVMREKDRQKEKALRVEVPFFVVPGKRNKSRLTKIFIGGSIESSGAVLRSKIP